MRHPQNGSWFIQDLCTVLNNDATQEDLASMITKVIKVVSDREAQLEIEDNSGRIQRMLIKQNPVSTSTLLKKAHFYRNS